VHKVKIAIDVDDVIRSYVAGAIDLYGWPDGWMTPIGRMWPRVDWDRHFEADRHALFLDSLKPIRGSKEAIERMLQWGYNPFLFTATKGGGIEERVTVDWLRRYNYPKMDIWFAGSLENKANAIILGKVKCDWLIEDHPKVLTLLQERDVKTIIYDAPWNRHIISGRRARTWKDVLAILEAD